MTKGTPVKSPYLFGGLLLIAVGTVLLVKKAGMTDLSWGDIAWLFVCLVGAVKLYRGFAHPSSGRGGIFWGTVLLLIGGIVFLDRLDVLNVPHYLREALLMFIGATGCLLVVVRRPGDWHLLVPAAAFAAIGVGTLMVDLSWWSDWEFRDAVIRYFPLACLVFGAAILARGALTRRVSGDPAAGSGTA